MTQRWQLNPQLCPLPAPPSPRSGSTRLVGVGDSGTCMLPGSDPKSQSFNSLDQSVRCQLLQAMPPEVQSATSAVDLAVSIASGNAPSPTAITAGLAGIATLVGGPAAGAVMATAGTIVQVFSSVVQGVLQALGLYQPPLPQFTYQGLQRLGVDQIPYSHNDTNNWLPFDRIQDLDWVGGAGWGTQGPNPRGSIGGRPDYNPTNAELTSPWQTGALAMLRYCLYFEMTPADRWAYDNGGWQNGVYLPTSNTPPNPLPDVGGMGPGSYAPLPPFEEFVRVLLLKSLTYWANGWPFVPPHDLVLAAAGVWNGQNPGPADTSGLLAHGITCDEGAPPENMTCYRAQTTMPGPSGGPQNNPSANIVSYALSGRGDSSGQNQNLPPIGVNYLKQGSGTQTSTSISTPAPTSSKATAAAGGLAAAGVVGAVVYSYVTGKTVETVLKSALGTLTDLFE